MKLLVIEDNPRLSEKMKQQLQKWYIIDIAQTGDEGMHLATTNQFDCILLDLGLPDIPGIEVCRYIRNLNNDVPILVVTGNSSKNSLVGLLDSGADDYIMKPFDITELHARINALARRRQRGKSVQAIVVGELTIHPSTRKVTRAGIEITLRRKEFDILEYLASNAGRVLPREMIIERAWPSNGASWPGSVDVHIKQLRDKIDRPFAYPLIKTRYGIGYIIELPEQNNPETPAYVS